MMMFMGLCSRAVITVMAEANRFIGGNQSFLPASAFMIELMNWISHASRFGNSI